MSGAPFLPYRDRYDPGIPPEEAARGFCDVMRRRRSVRAFSDREVSRETIEWLVRCAGTAPSGANKQPWRFVCVHDPALKHEIRVAAEEEEKEFYARRATPEWLEALAPLGTDENKGYLEVAPWLVALFVLRRGDDGSAVYYRMESAGLAAGFFLAAAHHAGLSTLTHTPSPMGFLNRILDRPAHEQPFLLIPVGYAAADCKIPAAALQKKPLHQIAVFR